MEHNNFLIMCNSACFCAFYIFGLFYILGKINPKIAEINKDNFIAHSGKISIAGIALCILTIILIKSS